MKAKRVLLIDDDYLPIQYYISRLEKNNYEVLHYLNPDDAFAYIEKERPCLDGIVLDIMLPPGRKYKNMPTNQGLKTGSFLLKDLLELYPKVPVVVLTNVRNPKTLAEFTESDLLKVAFKPDCPPKKLAELLDELLSPNVNNMRG